MYDQVGFLSIVSPSFGTMDPEQFHALIDEINQSRAEVKELKREVHRPRENHPRARSEDYKIVLQI